MTSRSVGSLHFTPSRCHQFAEQALAIESTEGFDLHQLGRDDAIARLERDALSWLRKQDPQHGASIDVLHADPPAHRAALLDVDRPLQSRDAKCASFLGPDVAALRASCDRPMRCLRWAVRSARRARRSHVRRSARLWKLHGHDLAWDSALRRCRTADARRGRRRAGAKYVAPPSSAKSTSTMAPLLLGAS